MGRAVTVSILVAIGISIATVGVFLERSKLTHVLSMMAMHVGDNRNFLSPTSSLSIKKSFRAWDRPLSFLLDRVLYIVSNFFNLKS